MQPNGQRQKSLEIAKSAFARIGKLKQPADPKSYALWYQYAAGDSGLLSAAVNARLGSAGTLTLQDIQELYSSHIAPGDTTEKVGRLGERIAGEIGKVAATIGHAQRAAGGHSAQLAQASRRLGGVRTRDDIGPLVAYLIKSAKEMAATNARLQSQLHTMWEDMAQLRRELSALRAECQTDPLTSLGNQNYFAAALKRAIAECTAANQPLALLLVDVDGIKAINQTYGHVVGDQVLRLIATTLKEGIAGRDTAARCRDDEFGLIFPRMPLASALKLAEQFRLAIMKCELINRTTGKKQARLTVSIGVAALCQGMSARALTETAGFCLHAAKRSGHNCVIGETDERLFAALGGITLSGAAVPFQKG